MADFCTNCHNELFPDTMKPEIDIVELWKELKDKPGYGFTALLCEGCGLRGLLNIDGKMMGQYDSKGNSKVGILKEYILKV